MEAEKRSAAVVAAACRDFGPQAKSLLSDELTCGQYLEALANRRLFEDAVRFIAYALPARQAVWWACLSLIELYDAESLAAHERALLKACAAWVIEPTEAARVKAERLANRTPAESAFHWLGRSTAYIEFPLPKPEYSELQDFRARGIAACLLMATTHIELAGLDKALAAWRTLIAGGYDVSRGAYPWPVHASQ